MTRPHVRRLGLLLLLIDLVGAWASVAAAQAPATARRPVRPLPTSSRDLVHQIAIARLPETLTARDRASFDRVVALLKKRDTKGANAEWARLVGTIARRRDGTNTDTLMNAAVRETYLASTAELQKMADKVRHYNETGAATSTDAELAEIRLQELIQKQQQLIQSLSNAMTMMHSTTMSVVGNIKP